MKLLEKSPLVSLLLANVVAFGFLLSAGNLSAFQPPPPGDYCDEEEASGCGCLEAIPPWLPEGCHEHAGTAQDCWNGEGCS